MTHEHDSHTEDFTMERRSSDRGAFAFMLKELNTKMNHVVEQLAEVSAQVKHISEGFPENDADGHRRYHEEVIRKEKESADFWLRLRIELAKWGLIGFAGWALFALWSQVIRNLKGLG